MDGSATANRLSGVRGTPVSIARSRFGLCARLDYPRRDEVRTAPRSPWQNAYVERVIGSIRRECLDHVIVVNAAGLHRVLTDYIAYYMRSRTHLALGKDTPITRPVSKPATGRIVTTPEVGGLHHRYDRIAA